MVAKEYNETAGVYKVQTFRTTHHEMLQSYGGLEIKKGLTSLETLRQFS